MSSQARSIQLMLLILAMVGGTGVSTPAADVKPGDSLGRKGDEIVVCGQLFHTTAPVVTWMDPGGYDAYRTERRFVPFADASWDKTKGGEIDSPNRFGLRKAILTPEQIEKVRGGGWDLPMLQNFVDQFVLHYDVCGTSKRCFDVLHDHRGLSVHFMLDVDGTIYQTLDLKERAWHATKANDRSIGIEIANMGAYPKAEVSALSKWYAPSSTGETKLTLPEGELPFLHRKGTSLKPIRSDAVVGSIQGQSLTQYDLTPEQYDSLTKLVATLCTVFPKIPCDYPRDASGKLLTSVLDDAAYKRYQGILGHYHVQTNKTDPGPALQWDKVIDGAKALMKKP